MPTEEDFKAWADRSVKILESHDKLKEYGYSKSPQEAEEYNWGAIFLTIFVILGLSASIGYFLYLVNNGKFQPNITLSPSFQPNISVPINVNNPPPNVDITSPITNTINIPNNITVRVVNST